MYVCGSFDCVDEDVLVYFVEHPEKSIAAASNAAGAKTLRLAFPRLPAI
jgi:hypothetical protein